MEANKILKAPLIDLVFDNRNKEYGAYQLRVTYPERIKRSLLITFGFSVLVFAGTVLASTGKKEKVQNFTGREYNMTAIEPKQDMPEPLPPPERKPLEPPPQERTVKLTTPTLADEVPDPPPTQDNASISNIGNVNLDGVDPTGIVDDTPIPGTGDIIETPVKEPEIFDKVEVPAKYDGDWARYLTRNLRAEVPVDNNAPAGKYKVQVKFVVDTDGTISDIIALTDVGYGMEKEAIRVLKQSKKWIPAFQNTRHVKAYHIQNIVFEVIGDE